MTKRNVTIQLDEHFIELAKMLAVRRGTSVSALLAKQIEDLTAADARYEGARRRAVAALDGAADRGGRSWQREDLYDRDIVG
ncbi:MAG: hypothetical protein ACRDQF_14695 [Thermocrispum sp.]